MARLNEPLWWALFAAGGMVAAMLGPATIAITGIAVPAGWVSEEALWALVHQPAARLYLVVLISLSLFHWAHRFWVTLVDMGLSGLRPVLPAICYATAFLGTVYAAWLMITL